MSDAKPQLSNKAVAFIKSNKNEAIMTDFLRKLFAGKRSSDSTGNDFSDFFVHTKSKEREKVIHEVLREANEEQREMVEKYKKEMRTV